MQYKLVTLLLFILLIGCQKDATIIEKDNRFKIVLGNSRKSMTWVTNQYNDILFSGFPDEVSDTLFLDGVSKNDTINLSLGYSSNGHFGINTYRDIDDGFDYQFANRYLNVDCGDSFVQGEGSKIVRLEVLGISDYDEIYFPDGFERIISKTDSSIFITSIMFNENDFILTILPKGGSTYKSFFLTNHAWSNQNNESLFEQNINFLDFSDAVVHEITLDKGGEYAFDIHIIEKNEGVVFLNTEIDTKDYVKGDKVKFFTTPEMEIDKIKFIVKVKGEKGWNYSSEILNYFPDKISFLDSDVEIDKWENGYNTRVSSPINLLQTTFFIGNDLISNWSIFQKPTALDNFTFPPVPPIFQGSFDPNLFKDAKKSTVNICTFDNNANQNYKASWQIENDCESYYCKLISTYY